jgi:hypothetical protein
MNVEQRKEDRTNVERRTSRSCDGNSRGKVRLV